MALDSAVTDEVVVLSGGDGTSGLIPTLKALQYGVTEVGEAFGVAYHVLSRRAGLVLASVDHPQAHNLLATLRRHPVTENVPVIYLDPGGPVARRVDLFRAGADDILPVGLAPEELDVRIQAHFRVRAFAESAHDEVEATRQLVDGVVDAVLLVDERDFVRHANRAARQLLELNPDLLRLFPLPELLEPLGVSPKLARELLEGPAGQARQVEVGVGNRSLHLRLQLENGGTDSAVRVVRIVDLTRAHQETQRVHRARAMILDGIRHPLRLVDGHLAHLQENPNDSALRVEAARDRLADAQQILEDALFLAQSDLGRPPVSLEVLDLATSAQEVVQDLAEWAEAQEVPLCLTADPATVLADPRRVHQVLSILISQAVQGTNPGQPVSIQVTAQGVRIQDVGATRLPRLMGPESSPHEINASDEYGLMLVARLVAAMGGDIHVTEAPIGMTNVEVRLPGAPNQVAENQSGVVTH